MSEKLTELRTQSNEQMRLAQEIQKKNGSGSWSAEEKKQFDAYIEKATELNAAFMEEKKHQENIETAKKGFDAFYGSREQAEKEADEDKEPVKHQISAKKTLDAHHQALHLVMTHRKNELFQFLRNTEDLTADHKQALMASIDSAGGFLAPPDFVAELVKDLAATASIPQLCRSYTAKSGQINFPVLESNATKPEIYSSKFAGAWVNEEDRTVTAQAKQGGSGFFSILNLPVGLYEPPLVPITYTMMEDDMVGLESEVRMALAEAAGPDLENAILNGDGLAKSPIGVLTVMQQGLAAAVGATEQKRFAVASGDADEVTYDGFTLLNAALPYQYHTGAVWVMHQDTLGKIYRLKGSTNDHPLVQPFTNVGSIWGKPIVISNLMPVEGADTFPVLLGNFGIGYALGSKGSLQVKMFDQTTPGMNLLYSRWRIGGVVRRKQAFRMMKCDTAL